MLRTSSVAALAFVALSCSGSRAQVPKAEAVKPMLDQEALALKTEGEKMNPNLGVKATWTVTAVDVQEQPGNKAQPYRGTIRFRINSEMKEPGGVVETNFEKKFDYVYDAAAKKWMFKP